MATEIASAGVIEPYTVPIYIPGPLNGDPYAQVFKGKIKPCLTMDSGTVSQQKKSYDLSKGIKDLDDLLGELGNLTSVNRQGALNRQGVSENINTIIDENANITTINELRINITNSHNVQSSYEPNGDIFTTPERERNNSENSNEEKSKPRLPARTSSFQAVTRHQSGSRSIKRSLSEGNHDLNHSFDSADGAVPIAHHVSVAYHETISNSNGVASDDVFDATLSPTVSDLLHDLSQSPLSTDTMRKQYPNRKQNLSLKYDNVEDFSDGSSDDRDSAKGGMVAAYAKQFNEMKTSPDPLKTSLGIPMPGLVHGVDYEDQISKFNYRSLAPGQRSIQNEQLYVTGNPPRKVIYESMEPDEVYPHSTGSSSYQSEPHPHSTGSSSYQSELHPHSTGSSSYQSELHPHSTGSSSNQSEAIFIPVYADRPVEDYLKEKRRQQELKLANGIVPTGGIEKIHDPTISSDDGHVVSESGSERMGPVLSETRSRTDSAYGESMKSSSTASTPVASNYHVTSKSQLDNSKSSDRGSETSSVTSLDDQESADYARIEDIRRRKTVKKVERSPVEESPILAASQTTSVESSQPSFTKLLNGSSPYRSVPNGNVSQVTVKTELKTDVSKSETRPWRKDSHKSTSSTHDTRKHRNGSGKHSTDGSSENVFLAPGVHLVESPPSPVPSTTMSRSSEGSLSPSPTRRTLRRGLRRSNNSSGSNSSLSSSELFPEVVRYPHIKFDKDTSCYWYKANISRDQAITLLKDKAPGTFVVRDSQSYEGAFGLAVKVATPPLGVIQQAGGDLSKVDLENELVRHFLIEPCRQGVRLKGSSNEPAFPSLVALIYQHSMTKMALPVELSMPADDVLSFGVDRTDGKVLTELELLQKGAACNLVFLASIDVEGLAGDGAVQYAFNKVMSSNFSMKAVVVNIKVNQDGITLTDNERRLFFRKHYSLKDVLHCALDPRGRRFNLKGVLPDLTYEAPCFGFVVRKPQKPLEHECHVFAEIEPLQPATAVITFIQRAMKSRK